jgi:hypothetical protein
MGGACDIHGVLMGKTECKYYLEGRGLEVGTVTRDCTGIQLDSWGS